MFKSNYTPLADPYNDLMVIDSRAPRTNQAVVGFVCILALLTNWWWLVGLMAAQLIIGLVMGRKYCISCWIYFGIIQPIFKEGELEDSRPPRFANIIGAIFLSVSSISFLLGLTILGVVLTAIVAFLATLAATTGFCLGCWLHKLIYGYCDVCDLPNIPTKLAQEQI